MIPQQSPLPWRTFLAAFFVANLALSSYFLDIWTTPNPVSRALPVLTLWEDGTYRIDEYASRTLDKSKVGEHFYTDKAPLPTLLAVPLYALLRLAGMPASDDRTGMQFPVYAWRVPGVSDGRALFFPRLTPVLVLGSFAFGSLPFALIVVMSFVFLRRVTASPGLVVFTMLAFYGSFVFVYAGTFFSHVFAGFLLLSSFLLLRRSRYFLAGLLLGLCFLSEYPVLIAAPIWAALLILEQRHARGALRLLAGVAPSVAAIMLYNAVLTGSPFTMLNAYHAFGAFEALGHHYGFAHPTLQSLWGLSLSGSMGLLVFAPVLAVIAWYAIKSAFRDKSFLKRAAGDPGVAFYAGYFLLISSFFTWWGGWSYGPRYLVVMAVPLMFQGMEWIARFRPNLLICSLVTGAGLASAWLAKATLVYMVPDLFLRDADYSNTVTSILIPEFARGHFNANNLPTMYLGASPAVGVWLWPLAFVLVAGGFSYWYRRVLREA